MLDNNTNGNQLVAVPEPHRVAVPLTVPRWEPEEPVVPLSDEPGAHQVVVTLLGG